ncbi:hypothetical protein L1887_50329 [Cichorium endivia]|nr:hypothetical protein L1887_50329 [Cichorium endivia]
MRSEFCFSRKALFHQVAPPQRSGLAVSLQSIGGENRSASQAGSATSRTVFIATLQILDLTSTGSWRNSMPEQETHLSEPSPASAESPKRKYRKWTREEEQKLVDILCANPSWADTLYPHRKNSRPACYSKSGLTKQSAALIRPDDPPSKEVVGAEADGNKAEQRADAHSASGISKEDVVKAESCRAHGDGVVATAGGHVDECLRAARERVGRFGRLGSIRGTSDGSRGGGYSDFFVRIERVAAKEIVRLLDKVVLRLVGQSKQPVLVARLEVLEVTIRAGEMSLSFQRRRGSQKFLYDWNPRGNPAHGSVLTRFPVLQSSRPASLGD